MGYIVVDGHCDSILNTAKGVGNLSEFNEGHLDFPRLKGNVNLQFMALFIEKEFKPFNTLYRGLELIDILKNEVKKTDYVKIVLNKKDLEDFSPLEVKILLSIEGGEVLSGSLGILRCLWELGIRSLTLTWNNRNQIGDGCGEEPHGKGLSKFGKSVIKEMNNLGMVIDVSHLAEKSFWEVINISEKPVIASHSCCRALMNHPRNLSDSQLKALAEQGGIIGINFYPVFLRNDYKKATLDDVVRHINHACEIMGSGHVGLGSDFDGIDHTPIGLEDVTKIKNLITALEKRGFSSIDIANIMGNSYINILKKVLPDG